MRCLVCMFIVLGLLSPLCAESVIVYDDFEGAAPGTQLNTLPGWSGADGFAISAATIDQGQSLDASGGAANSWPRITRTFSYTPTTEESYVFSGTLWVESSTDDYAHAQLSVDGNARLIVALGYNELVCQYEGPGITASDVRIPMVYNQDSSVATMDFKLVLTGDSFDGYWRVNGDSAWIYAGQALNGIDIAEFTQVDLYGHGGYPGKIDTISLTAVPEPTTIVLCLIGLSTLFILRRRG